MYKISSIHFTPIINSIYVKPLSMHYTINGVQRNWDLLQIHDSVSILLYNISRNVLVFVKQFRPAVYYNSIPQHLRNQEIDVTKYPPELGITIELCAGIVDKDLPLVEIAREEVFEECGYTVPSDKLVNVGTCRSGVGVTGSRQTLFYCEVTDDMKTSSGGGVDDEYIQIVEMNVPDVQEYITKPEVLSPGSFMYAIYWFLTNKLK